MLRLSAVVLVVYAGHAGLTWWQFYRTPTGFIPQQDKGYLILNVQLPDSASLDRTENVMAQIEKPAPQTPGVAHTIGISGQSLILNANAPNLGSLYVLLQEFDKRRGRGLDADSIAAAIQEALPAGAVREAVVAAFGAPPIDGLGTTGGFDLDRRGPRQPRSAGLGTVQRPDRHAGQPDAAACRTFSTAPRANTPWIYLDIDRDKCMALGVAVSDVFNTLQVYLGSYYVNNFNDFGRTWQVIAQAGPRFRSNVLRHARTCRSATTRARWCGCARSWRCTTPAGRWS